MTFRVAPNVLVLLFLASAFALPASAGYEEALKAYKQKNWPSAYVEADLLARQGDARGQALLATLFNQGLGVKRNFKLAERWYSAAADQGHSGSLFALGLMHMYGSAGDIDLNKARDLFERAARLGHAQAAHNVGLIFAGASGGKVDWKQAATWFTMAAKRGFAEAQYNLGILFAEGKGVQKDMVKAGEWLSKAALKGLKDAARDYGIMIFKGDGVQRDEKIGAKWLLFAADKGDVMAQNRIARLYMVGRGVEQNSVEAARWHLLARESGMRDEKLESFASQLETKQLSLAQKLAMEWRNSSGIESASARNSEVVKGSIPVNNQLK